ncbi:MAG: putative fusion protein (N:peptidase-C:desuccinylase) [Parcubacteria group bacterium Gr01-1014_38]|nr:MAG: putative fusion protein (N:peptidase-C:desuccinylase) [Parcubacteria group bacterium Gr01-1014_38]
MKLLRVPLARERPGLCGPYTLAAVLRFHGDRASLAILTRLCRATRARGTSPERLAAAARARGFRTCVKAWADFGDLAAALRRGLPPIVLWFSGDEGHYSAVSGLDRTSVALADPELGKIRRMPRDVFRRVWFDFSTSGPEKTSRLYARWMLVIEPREEIRYSTAAVAHASAGVAQW